mmetsp:Transcript_1036/g.2678  ORF Transcript_1036/g.2678 Transcript_1036/m.2678 type:complete len:355 (+) Transcript_1036:136-1200(+)
MEASGAIQKSFILDDERHVDVGGAVRHHLHLDLHLLEHLEGLPQDGGLVLLVGDQRQHAHALPHLHLGHLLQLFLQALEIHSLVAAIERQGHGHLRRRDHVDRNLELVQHIEDVRQEAVLAQHARAPDDDHRDLALAAHRGDKAVSQVCRLELREDPRSWLLRSGRVEDADGHRHHPHRQDRCWVHHLGAECGQLRRLLEGEDFHRPGGGDDAGVGRHHAAHILPDLHFRRLDRCADDRGRQVGAVTPERRDGALGVLGDVAGDHRKVGVVLPERKEELVELYVCLRQHLALREGRIGAAAAARRAHARLPAVYGLGLGQLLLQFRRGHMVEQHAEDSDAQALPEGDDEVPRSR